MADKKYKEKHKKKNNPERLLSAQQEKFCTLVAAGKSGGAAYEESYDCKRMTRKSIYEQASRLRARRPIQDRIREIILDRYSGVMMSQEERIKVMNDIILFGETAHALKALDMLNKMDGSYIEKIEMDVTASIKYHSLEEYYIDAKKTLTVE